MVMVRKGVFVIWGGDGISTPLLAQAFYFTEIVERWGSGTTRMAELCTAQNLPAPEFAQVSGEVHVTFRKDPFTDYRLRALGLSDRQIQTVRYVREKGSISNAEHRALIGNLPDRTASGDLDEMVEAGVLIRLHGELEAVKMAGPHGRTGPCYWLC